MATAIKSSGRAMTEQLDPDSPTGRLNVPASERLLSRIEEWRARQRPVLAKAAAARKLIEMALAMEDEQAPTELTRRERGKAKKAD